MLRAVPFGRTVDPQPEMTLHRRSQLRYMRNVNETRRIESKVLKTCKNNVKVGKGNQSASEVESEGT